MQKHEYTWIQCPLDPDATVHDKLRSVEPLFHKINDAGLNGWRLTSVTPIEERQEGREIHTLFTFEKEEGQRPR